MKQSCIHCVALLVILTIGLIPAKEIDLLGEGWKGWAGDSTVWTFSDGELIGGPSRQKVYIAYTAEEVQDVEIRLEIKLSQPNANSGLQFRSSLSEKLSMKGPQADAGQKHWGSLYGEGWSDVKIKAADSCRNTMQPTDWNRMRILAEGNRYRIFLNDNLCVDEELTYAVPGGHIGIQHHGGDFTIHVRELRVFTDGSTSSSIGDRKFPRSKEQLELELMRDFQGRLYYPGSRSDWRTSFRKSLGLRR